MTSQLEDSLGQALHDLTESAPFTPDLTAIERRGRRLKTRAVLTRGGIGAGVVAIAAAAVGLQGSGTAPAPQQALAPSAAPEAPLAKLADYVLAAAPKLTGDATEVIRTQTYPDAPAIVGGDLYADNGEYFFSQDPAGLPAAVKADEDVANGVFGREVAIARAASAGGDIAAAQRRLAVANLDPGQKYVFVTPSPEPPSSESAAQRKAHPVPLPSGAPFPVDFANSVWMNATDALIAGAGRPDVRAGVLRILSTLPGITVTDTTTGGKPTVTVSASGAELPAGYRETLVVGAQDGIPVRFTGGDDGKPASVTVTYQVRRVSLADWR